MRAVNCVNAEKACLMPETGHFDSILNNLTKVSANARIYAVSPLTCHGALAIIRPVHTIPL